MKASENNSNTCKNTIPTNALICGLYQGSVPQELSDLNWYERSMVSIYSCISRVKVLSGKHYKKCGTAYTVINDLVKVTDFFPRMLNYDELAIIRHRSETTTRDYKFNPKKVWRALRWLISNNHLYKDIKICPKWPDRWKENTPEGTESPIDLEDVPYIELTDEQIEELDTEYKETIVSASSDETNDTLELQQEKEVFLNSNQDIRTHEENLVKILSSTSMSSSLKPDIFSVSSNHEFVNPYYDPLFFWAKCFPWLYPYGFGCPSDKNSSLRGLGAHTRQMLMRGGGPQGRRFQQCPSYYFASYHYQSRRKMGGITSKAQNSKYNGLSEKDDAFNAAVLSRMITYAKEKTGMQPLSDTTLDNIEIENEISMNSLNCPTKSSSPPSLEKGKTSQAENIFNNDFLKLSKMTKQEFEFYSKRLAIYGKSLPGTALHMKNERCNLMSMLAAPSVEEDGIWRWFVTLSPADLFDPRLYEVLAASDEEFLNWEERRIKARSMSKEKRAELLSLHPALAARLFEIQQQAIWDCIIGR